MTMNQQEEKVFNTNWNIVVIPNDDGTLTSKHLGISVEGAVHVLKAVLADYEAELETERQVEGQDDGS